MRYNAQLHVLCRSSEQLKTVLDCGVSRVIGDLRDAEENPAAVETAHAAGAEILLATPRIQKPGELEIVRRLLDCRPDGILARNLAGLSLCAQRGAAVVADFSLHAANELTVHHLHELGAGRITAAYDLDQAQLLELAKAVPPAWLEVVVRRHTPLFHTEHCVFCDTLSPGRDRTDCGQPCRRHDVRLRDRRGFEHPLRADAACRNTLFHADSQDMAAWMRGLIAQGVRHFRIEFLDSAEEREVKRVLSRYRKLVTPAAR